MVERYQPLTDLPWQVIAPLRPEHGNRRLTLRHVLGAVRYLCRTAYQWRSVPRSFPAWTAVSYYFRRWQGNHTWSRLHEAVNRADRVAARRDLVPPLICGDSRSVKLAPRIFEHWGLDSGKRVTGRKGQVATDVEGRIFAGHVHAANGPDGPVAAAHLLPTRPS